MKAFERRIQFFDEWIILKTLNKINFDDTKIFLEDYIPVGMTELDLTKHLSQMLLEEIDKEITKVHYGKE